MPPIGDLACYPGMCPDWELNRRSLSSQASTQSTGPHRPEQDRTSVWDGEQVLEMDGGDGCLSRVPHRGPGPQPRHVP